MNYVMVKCIHSCVNNFNLKWRKRGRNKWKRRSKLKWNMLWMYWSEIKTEKMEWICFTSERKKERSVYAPNEQQAKTYVTEVKGFIFMRNVWNNVFLIETRSNATMIALHLFIVLNSCLLDNAWRWHSFSLSWFRCFFSLPLFRSCSLLFVFACRQWTWQRSIEFFPTFFLFSRIWQCLRRALNQHADRMCYTFHIIADK